MTVIGLFAHFNSIMDSPPNSDPSLGKGSLHCNTAASGFYWDRIFPPTQRICSLQFILHRSFKVDIICLPTVRRRRDSDWLRAGLPGQRSLSPGRVKNFLFSKSSRPVLGSTLPPIQWVPRTLFPGLKRPGREADHSLPSSDEVKNIGAIRILPSYVFMVWCLNNVAHRPVAKR
jgi:hypothetical protein